MVILFERNQSVISRHINNIFTENEIEKNSNMHFLHITNIDRPVAYYSLDVIISVGYQVKSKRGTQFRIWANSVLKDYLLKGYAVNNRFELIENRLSKVEYQQFEIVETITIKNLINLSRKNERTRSQNLINLIKLNNYD